MPSKKTTAATLEHQAEAQTTATEATPSKMPVPAYPANMDEANRWIAQLHDAYHREHAYVERLEAEQHRQRAVIDMARYWHHARGMHRAPWLSRLRDAVVGLEDAEAQAKAEGRL